jgi:DNA-binding MarR family transcriptional regulator
VSLELYRPMTDVPQSRDRSELEQEIKQTRPFRTPEALAFVEVLRTSAVLTGEMVETLRPSELTMPQYNVLRILRGAGPAGLPSGEVGERLVSREPDVTRLLDRMEARGLVARERGTRDRRVVTARLTEEGLRLVDSLDDAVEALHERQLGHLSRDELRSLSTLLGRVRHREG